MPPDAAIKNGGGSTEGAAPSESTPPASRVNSNNNIKAMPQTTSTDPLIVADAANAKRYASRKTLAARSKIPYSMYSIAMLVIGAQWSGGVYSIEVMTSVANSWRTGGRFAYLYLAYIRNLSQAVATGHATAPKEIATAAFATVAVGCCLYVLIYVPLRAGMWTGKRARRHKMHRYLGLLFLTQYFLAWVEYICNYDEGGKDSYLSHFVGVNGIVQGVTAFFSFKVLPTLVDPGYYSDKAVLSRSFVHENTFFSTLTFLGSCLYHDTIRTTMMSNPVGRTVMFCFVYWMYVIIRPLFPVTSFSKAGTRNMGRTEANERFYRIGTIMVKFFYLWAKYFLGFVLNWVVYLGKASEGDMFFVRGLYLLNVGTISISVFLHTLRFKKALPPVVAFSIYLGQIYGTFLALPYCYNLFVDHKMLMALGVLGLVVNMARNWYLHAAWCGLCVFLLEFTAIEW